MSPLKYFEDFLSIPRESGNEKKISDYLVRFAVKHNLEYFQDESNNVIIRKKSNCGSTETIVLQGHIDMVCVSTFDYDFKNNGINWYIEDGFYKANGTTLGADNGVGCSIILSVLSNDNLKIPNIEAVFTTNEETNMYGAKTLDYSKITGNKIISIDGTDEGVIEVSSAGMININISEKIKLVKNKLPTYRIKIYGLQGGHSGIDIDKKRGNSIKIMLELLSKLNRYRLISINGGNAYNVIPDYCECIIAISEPIMVDFKKYKISGIKIEIELINTIPRAISIGNTATIVNRFNLIPTGVISTFKKNPKTSINLAVIEAVDDMISLKLSIRSSDKLEESSIISLIKKSCSQMKVDIVDTTPFFEYKKKSQFRDLLAKKYLELFNRKIKINHVHAGLEGGVFSENIEDMDMCVIAPNIYGIHTVDEKVEIESIFRVYTWLTKFLESI